MAAEIEINETVSNTIEADKVTHIEFPFSAEGVTIHLNVTNGSIVLYASDQTPTPNEAFYDWMIETDGYSDVFLDPHLPHGINRTIGDTVYVAIEGVDESNNFTLTVVSGDTTIQESNSNYYNYFGY